MVSWADHNRCPGHVQLLMLILSVQFEMPVVCPIQVFPCPVLGILSLWAITAPMANTAFHTPVIASLHVPSWGTQVWGPQRPLQRLPDLDMNAVSPLHGGNHCFLHVTQPGGSEVKASDSNAGDPGSIPGLGRSPGEGNGNPLQYSSLENPIDRGAW